VKLIAELDAFAAEREAAGYGPNEELMDARPIRRERRCLAASIADSGLHDRVLRSVIAEVEEFVNHLHAKLL
jgi:hypothetical protein